MIPKLSRPFLLAVTLATATTALAGPDPVDVQATVRQPPVVKWHKKIVDTVLIACGVVEPPPVYVAPGYLETTGPAPMLVYRAPAALHPRRVAPSDGEEKPAAAAPAANPAPGSPAEPASSPVPAPLTAPVPAPSPAVPALDPALSEPGILPESNGSAVGSQADELLSYFRRQHAVAHPYSASPLPPGEAGPNDPSIEPSFLLAPQAPEQPVLPPSRATYHVAP